MKPYLIAAAVAAAVLAGCGRDDTSASPKASDTSTPKGPATASGGASGASPTPGPTGDTTAKAPSATPSTAGSASAEAKPDPGDANDHSNPQHDAKARKKNGD